MARGVAECLVGRRYGNLVVLAQCGRRGRHILWRCKCDCGEETFGTSGNLNFGGKKSCGCMARGAQNVTHGLSGSPEYKAWDGAKGRCRNPANRKYHQYGGRGIKMCRQWEDSFAQFIADMGMRPTPLHSLDRIDVNGDYEPANCRWATMVEQNNNRRFNRHLVVAGQKMTVSQASALTGVPHSTILGRLDAGKSDQEAVRG